jgi:asparagine synthase (glutamine-hydrolysing)
VARQAFADLLPEAVLSRRSKGGPTTFAYEIVDAGRGHLLESLMDGVLAERNLIDRVALEGVLGGTGPIPPADYLRLLQFAEAEAWCRHWVAREGSHAMRVPSHALTA